MSNEQTVILAERETRCWPSSPQNVPWVSQAAGLVFFPSLVVSEFLGPPQLAGGDGQRLGKHVGLGTKRLDQIPALPLLSCVTLSG